MTWIDDDEPTEVTDCNGQRWWRVNPGRYWCVDGPPGGDWTYSAVDREFGPLEPTDTLHGIEESS